MARASLRRRGIALLLLAVVATATAAALQADKLLKSGAPTTLKTHCRMLLTARLIGVNHRCRVAGATSMIG